MILVTGATGNIGKELVKILIDKGERFRILVRDEKKVIGLSDQVEIAIGDLSKPETLGNALKGIDRLFLVTPDTGQVKALLEMAKQSGIKHVVKISTIEANRSLGPGKWHRQQEELIKSMGFAWTFLRPTMLMVNIIDWWGATIKSQETVYFPGGSGKVPPVDPCDVAAVACTVLTEAGHTGKIYEITGAESLTISEMVETLGKVLGKPIHYTDVPVFAAAFGMLRFRLPIYVVMGLMQTLGALRRSEYAYVTDVVEKVGNRKPQTFEEWCQTHKHAFQ